MYRHSFGKLSSGHSHYIHTLLSRETESETEVLYSSGYLMASVCIRLTAAVTTPWTDNRQRTTFSVILDYICVFISLLH